MICPICESEHGEHEPHPAKALDAALVRLHEWQAANDARLRRETRQPGHDPRLVTDAPGSLRVGVTLPEPVTETLSNATKASVTLPSPDPGSVTKQQAWRERNKERNREANRARQRAYRLRRGA